MEIVLSGMSKLGFVRGKYPKPDDLVMVVSWRKCNDILISWLISLVSASIGEYVLCVRRMLSRLGMD